LSSLFPVLASLAELNKRCIELGARLSILDRSELALSQ
jgi:hypothetical protein